MAGELKQAQRALRELGKWLKNLPEEPAVEQVHKLRTTTRRVEALVAALPVGGPKTSQQLLKSIEPVRKAAGGVRDMDVLKAKVRRLARGADGGAMGSLIEQLENSRRQSAAELQRAVRRRGSAARENLKQYSKLLRAAKAGAHDGGAVHPAALRVLRELGAWPALESSNLHGFRLKVKLLRYILQLDEETAPGLIEALGQVQRLAGEWHDWLQLEEMARGLLDAEKDAEVLARIGATAQRRFRAALKAANALRARYLLPPRAVGI
jgi:CHAD domain-containing protein